MSQNLLSRFHPLIERWFVERLGNPTEVQTLTWTEVIDGRHVLVTAPTGSGKTLAAFLWSINQLVTGAWPAGRTRVLYISPLKALNNDVRRNLMTPLEQISEYFRNAGEEFPDINVQTRSGDTPGSERQRMLRKPPEILITTPESLNILLASRNSRQLLTGISTVILDEIHAVAGSKRGTHLITAVDRLVPLCGEFHRIALSATVRPLETVADFVGGYVRIGKDHYERRKVSIILSGQEKKFQIQIRSPEERADDPAEDFWPRLVREFKKIISRHRSTLFFANSRRTAEKVTRMINEDESEELAYSHHGSLSREIRLAVEERLKRGELKAIVATNSLELGIDIGMLDSVVLIQSPRSISSAIQRIGRSGHGVGEVSRGLLFPTHGMDFLEAAVIARSIMGRDMEELRPVESPLDILAQIILSMALPEEWDIDELYSFLKASYPYRNLSRRHFDLVIEMLEGRYADSRIQELRPRIIIDRITNSIRTKEGASTLIYMEGGTIPDRGYYDLRLKESGAKIGELDEEFVWERKIGDTFTLGAQVWQIKNITHNNVEVVPAQRTYQIIPFWRAEEIDRDHFYSEKIASFLEDHNENVGEDEFIREMMEKYSMMEEAAGSLSAFLRRQKETTKADLPHRHHLLIEHYNDPMNRSDSKQAVLHTLWGNGINRPFTFALSAAWEEKYGYPLQAFYNNDAIALLFPHEFEVSHIFSLVTPANIESLLRSSLEVTGYFGARFRENAGRALLLSKINFRKRMPLWLNRLRSKKLLGAVLKYRDFPILLETWRSCLQDEFDLTTLKQLLNEIQDGEIRISETHTAPPSPFAGGLIWQQTNKYMYEDDTPDSGKVSALGHDLIRELVSSPHLRPRIPSALVKAFEKKRQRTAEGYSPDSGRELIGWVKERLLIPRDEWFELLDSIVRDHAVSREDLITEVADRIVWMTLPGTEKQLICSIESLPEIARGLGRDRDGFTLIPILSGREEIVQHLAGKMFRKQHGVRSGTGTDPETCDDTLSSMKFLGQWLSFYGPVELSGIERILPVRKDLFEGAMQSLEETGQIILDRFREESRELEVCDASNLETLLRIHRRSRQPAFQALDIHYLPLLLAAFQGLAQKGSSIDDLQKRLEQLFGFPAAAGAWEEEMLPARMEPYFTAWLDSLMQTSDLLWFGCGERKLSFAFPEDLDLFQQDHTGSVNGKELIPYPKGRYSFSTIYSHSGLSVETVSGQLWKLTWKGELSNDSFATVRKGIVNRFRHYELEEQKASRRLSANRWNTGQRTSGNWYLLGGGDGKPDVIEKEEMNKERVRVLLDRYGILFRELLLRELPLLQWNSLFRTLRIMELSGEVLSGSFFTGIPGLQFISHEAFRILNKGLPEDSIYWLNAADPASLCGTGLEGLRADLPPRTPMTHLVYHGTRLVVISRRHGKELRINAGPDDPHLSQYFSFFRVLVSREFNPKAHILIEHINGTPARQSEYRIPLREFGFQESYKGMELWRKY